MSTDRTDEEAEKPVALFDLDGTLADFDGQMRAWMSRLADPAEPEWNPSDEANEPDHVRERRRLVKQRPGFWRGLPELADGFALLKMADEAGYQIHILSRGPRANPTAWAEKLEWVRRHIISCRIPSCQVTITEDKGLTYGRVLVDDWPPYIERWLRWRKRGLVLMPDRPWNRDFHHVQVVRCAMAPGSEGRGQFDEDIRGLLLKHARRER